MPKFLIEAAYTAEGLRGLQKDKASGRRDAVVKAVQGLEGKVEAFYFAMGKRDVVVIAELPDAVTAAATGEDLYRPPQRRFMLEFCLCFAPQRGESPGSCSSPD